MEILVTISELISSAACGALNGLKKLKIGLIEIGLADGQGLIQSQRLCEMVVILYTFSIVLVETMNYSGGFHFHWRRYLYFRAGLQLSRLSTICSDSSQIEN